MTTRAAYEAGDYVWCDRCQRVECVGAVLHHGPYTSENSRRATREEMQAVYLRLRDAGAVRTDPQTLGGGAPGPWPAGAPAETPTREDQA